jgi:hypothetical protein
MTCICPIITGHEQIALKPVLSVLINLAIPEQAAMTEGSSIAIGTEYSQSFMTKLSPNPIGIERSPMQFSIIKSAVF